MTDRDSALPGRRVIRVCARCGRGTENAVVVHRHHAATGPGCDVHACQECAAAHYPPPVDPLGPLATTSRTSRMAMRVYKVTADGRRTQDRAEIHIWTGNHTDPLPQTAAFPPCACPRCDNSSQTC
ncbi:hypothetical protein [Streptomyces adelaidensis]|uniref:hypothetical protein n=1 Tax=Streptomyces adelaidensis TaxID=2796465 RepID=UPI001908D5A7|nr:hypothetical protein [Streptomyces adelaidensis]